MSPNDEREDAVAAVADDRRRGVAPDAHDAAGLGYELAAREPGVCRRHHLDVDTVVEKLLGGGQRLRLVALVVLGDDLDLHGAAGRVDLLSRELHAVLKRNVVGGVRAGQRSGEADAKGQRLAAPLLGHRTGAGRRSARVGGRRGRRGLTAVVAPAAPCGERRERKREQRGEGENHTSSHPEFLLVNLRGGAIAEATEKASLRS